MTNQEESNQGWRVTLLSLGTISVVFVGAFFDSIKDLFLFWDDSSTYGHGLLLVPISLYLVYTKRKVLQKLRPETSLLGLLALLCSVLFWLISNLISIQLLVHASLILMVASIVLGILGYQLTKLLLIPILILFSGINIWFPLEYLFQDITTAVTVFLLELLRVPFFLEGHTIKLVSGDFFVDTSCAGLRFFLVTLLISAVYGYLNITNRRNLLLIMAFSIVLSIVSNWIRVFTIVYVGHLSDMNHPLVHQHVEFGWILFVVLVMPCFFFLAHYVQKRDEDSTKQ